MFEAMVLGGLRRCGVFGLRLDDLDGVLRQVFIVEGKDGQQPHPHLGPVLPHRGRLSAVERPAEATTDRVFVVLKGKRRGHPLSDEGLKQIFTSARKRAGLRRITCHELRHTRFTRLREAGMELKALQAQAGHRHDLPIPAMISVEALYVASSLVVLSTCFVIQRASICWWLCRYR